MKYLKYIFSKEFWQKKELINQAEHMLVALIISIVAFLIFGNFGVCLFSVACFALGMETDHYAKAPSVYKFIDCVRDFIFYMTGACGIYVVMLF